MAHEQMTHNRLNVPRILQGMALSTAIGGLAYKRGSLSESGWLGAVLTGTPTFGFGGWDWGLTLVSFFISSSVLSHYKEQVKQQRTGEVFAKGSRRDLAQALANGGPGALVAIAYVLFDEAPIFKAIFLGINATTTADTWATELGVLSTKQPRLITTLQPVQPGTSGAITTAGTAASAAGGLFIGLTMFGVSAIQEAINPAGQAIQSHVWMIPAGLLGGLAGSLSDSLLSATVQIRYVDHEGKETERAIANDGTPNRYARGIRWFTNDLVNLTSTVTGSVVASAIYAMFGKKRR